VRRRRVALDRSGGRRAGVDPADRAERDRRATEQRPPDGWPAAGFDEAGWGAPQGAGADVLAPFKTSSYVFDQARGRGQPIYAFAATELWGRVTFAVPETP
jgi:hypothetical protein